MTEKLQVPASAPAGAPQRRRSSLEGLPLFGSYLKKKHDGQASASYLVRYMSALSDFFHRFPALLLPHEIAYFIKVFALPIRATAMDGTPDSHADYRALTAIPQADFLKYFDGALLALNHEAGDILSAGQVRTLDAAAASIYGLLQRHKLGDVLVASRSVHALLYTVFILQSADTLSRAQQPDTEPAAFPGVAFDVTLLHYLATYVFRDARFGEEFVTPNEDKLAQIELQYVRITPATRCISFDGAVGTYGKVAALREKRGTTHSRWFESQYVRLASDEDAATDSTVAESDRLSSEKDASKDRRLGVSGTAVFVEGAFRKPQDLWRYV